MSKRELLLCPFCNGRGQLCKMSPQSSRQFPVVRCLQCFAEISGRDNDHDGETAIKAWNSRFSSIEDAAAIARFKVEARSASAKLTRMRKKCEAMQAEIIGMELVRAAMRAYLPPGGISKDDFINRVLQAVDPGEATPVDAPFDELRDAIAETKPDAAIVHLPKYVATALLATPAVLREDVLRISDKQATQEGSATPWFAFALPIPRLLKKIFGRRTFS